MRLGNDMPLLVGRVVTDTRPEDQARPEKRHAEAPDDIGAQSIGHQ